MLIDNVAQIFLETTPTLSKTTAMARHLARYTFFKDLRQIFQNAYWSIVLFQITIVFLSTSVKPTILKTWEKVLTIQRKWNQNPEISFSDLV